MHVDCSKFSILSNVEQMIDLLNVLRKPLLMYTLAHLFLPSTSIPDHEDLQLTASEKELSRFTSWGKLRFHEHPEQLVLEVDGYCVYCHYDGAICGRKSTGRATVTPA